MSQPSYSTLTNPLAPVSGEESVYGAAGNAGAPMPYVESSVAFMEPTDLTRLPPDQLRRYFISPLTYDEAYEKLKQSMGNQLDQQYQQTLSELQSQLQFLEERQRQLQRKMNEPVNPMERLLPLVLMGSYTGETDLVALGGIMQMLMLPQLEEQKRNRYWNAIADVLAEKNRVITALRTWESLSLRERQALMSNARMLSGQVTTTALRAIDLYSRHHLQRTRLMMERERTLWGQRRVATRTYMSLYDDLLKTLDNYPNIEARRQIYQAFLPALNQLAQEAGLANPPHASLGGVLSYPSLRTSQSLVQLINSLQRLELNQVLYHASQLGLINRQIAIQKGLQQLRAMQQRQLLGPSPSSNANNRLSLPGLLHIYNFTYYAEDTANDNPEAIQILEQTLGSNWRDRLVEIRANIASQILQMASQQSGNAAPIDPNQIQQLANDPVSLRNYLEYLAGTQGIMDLPLDPFSAQFVQDIYGNIRSMARDSNGRVMPTFSMNDFVQQLHRRALELFGQYVNWQGGGDVLGPLSEGGSATGSTPSAAPAPSTVTPNAQGASSQGGVAVRGLNTLLFPSATRSNILDMQAFSDMVNQGAALDSPNPQVQQVFQRIANRHMVQFQLPNGQPVPGYRPLMGISQPQGSSQTDLQTYNSYLAYRPIRIGDQTRIVASVPVMSYQLSDGNQTHRFDISRNLRQMLMNPNTRTLVDVVLLEGDSGTQLPYLVVSVPYTYSEVVGGRTVQRGVRVPVLMLPFQSLGTIFSQQIMDASLRNYVPQVGNQNYEWQPSLGAATAQNVQKLVDAFLQAWSQRSETILNNVSDPAERQVQLNTELQRLWQQFQDQLRQDFGYDVFQSILWAPVGF